MWCYRFFLGFYIPVYYVCVLCIHENITQNDIHAKFGIRATAIWSVGCALHRTILIWNSRIFENEANMQKHMIYIYIFLPGWIEHKWICIGSYLLVQPFSELNKKPNEKNKRMNGNANNNKNNIKIKCIVRSEKNIYFYTSIVVWPSERTNSGKILTKEKHWINHIIGGAIENRPCTGNTNIVLWCVCVCANIKYP